jgi:pimeloyl-ACP methyl ester carboxylesterase
MTHTTGFVISRDGTTIGYRRLGRGPGLVLVHGGMQSSRSFMKLGVALSDRFTVYIPDRRGRGLSGPFGANHAVERESEDLRALLSETGADQVFGLSSGAILVMRTTLTLPAIRKIALFEPPIPLGQSSLTTWVGRYDDEIARGDLASAFITLLRGTGDSIIDTIPRFLLAPLLRLGIAANARVAVGERVSLAALIPTMHYDAQLVTSMAGELESFKDLRADVLLLGGSESERYLRAALDALSEVLPGATRVELPDIGHLAADDSGKPELVARHLLRFFEG